MREDSASSFASETAGAILAAARRKQNLDRTEISSHLRLSPWQIEALENDQYDRLAGPTFIRGIIRSYAKSLQIDPQPALHAYSRVALQVDQVAINVPSQNIRFNPGNGHGWRVFFKVGIAFFILAIIGVAIWFWRSIPNEEAKKTVSAPEVRAVQSTTAQPADSLSQITTAQPSSTAASSRLTVAPAPMPSSVGSSSTEQALIVSAAQPAVAPGKPVLHFSFQEESWVEVKNGKGKTILYQLNSAGSEQVLTGDPPFALVIGNAPSVHLSYNDKPVDLIPYTQVRVARLTIE